MYSLHFYLYLGVSALAAILSISMWLDYFRKIDVFEPEKLKYLIFALFIGCGTPYISLFFYHLVNLTGFTLNGDISNDLFYTIVIIGANEELSKIIGVIVAFRLLRNHIKEPIDYLIYAGLVALGFSIVENFKYFNAYGLQIITTRAFYSALVHIINTTIIVYGFYSLKLFGKGSQITNTLLAFAVSASSHGLFDFFLMNNFIGPYTPFFSMIVYLVGINFWGQMLNNANNFSQNFNYEKIHNSGQVFYRLLFWYLTTLIFTIIYNMIVFSPKGALNYFFASLSSDGLLLFVVILRASRFRFFKLKYFDVKVELPFYITRNEDEDFKLLYFIPIKIRGESAFEYKLTTYLNKTITLHPLNLTTGVPTEPLEVNLTDKLLLKNDVIVYKANHEGGVYYLKPKTRGETETEDNFPISGLFKLNSQQISQNTDDINYKDLAFLEWIYIKD
ncbi:MAG TPA: PrsW family glutamic-type intramembrane protease [Bacteroidia bacterium]|jgi:RsiW-degrading membrane proteinase PrsW (M82 family)|nr:PrsW family glutamic-type intramembrane protease [Bacteroidia bacterium]